MRGNKVLKFIDIFFGVILLILFRIVDILIFPFRLILKNKKGNILVIKFSAMGDTILILPVLRRLRSFYPDRKIVMVATKVNDFVVKDSKYADEVMTFDIKWFINPLRLFSFVFKLLSYRFEIAFDLDQWLRVSPLIAFLSGAGKRIGFRTKGQFRHYLYTASVPQEKGKHEAELFFDIIAKYGIDHTSEDMKLFFDTEESDKKDAENLIKALGLSEKYCVIHPGCGAHGYRRQWPEEKYAEVIAFLEKEGYDIIISAGGAEKDIYEKICSICGRKLKLIMDQRLPVLAELIRKSAVYISGNTGVMHLACAVDANVIALHGPTDPVKWGPRCSNAYVIKSDMDCSPCLFLGSDYGCNERHCMEGIQSEKVIKVIKDIENNK